MTLLRRFLCALCIVFAVPALAQGTKVAFGSIQQDTSAPVEVTADALSIDQDTGVAIFVGNVLVGQGAMRLSAPRVEVIYNDDNTAIDRMEATGGVTLVSGDDAAEAQRADYSVNSGVIVMTGDVLMTQGISAISGDKMTVNLDDGTARVQGRVKSILRSGNN